MSAFLQVTAGVLLAVVLGIVLSRHSADMTLVLTVAVCCMVLTVMASYLEPVLDFIRSLQQMGGLDPGMLEIVLKAVGVGLVGEIAGMICADSGNSALGKAIQLLAGVMVLWLSIPLMTSLVELVQSILGEV